MPAALTTGETLTALSLTLGALGIFVTILTLAWKQGRSEGRFNEAITNLANAITSAKEEAKKDADELWSHQRAQDSKCAAQIAHQASLEGEIKTHLAMIPGIAESVENLRRETKQDIGDLRKEIKSETGTSTKAGKR